MTLLQPLGAGAIGLLVLRRAAGQVADTIRGVVADGATGAPVCGAKAAAFGGGRAGRVLTDSVGHYLLDRVRPGRWTVQFNCPSRTMLGRKLAEREVTVPTAGEAMVNGVVDSVIELRLPVRDGCWHEGRHSRTPR